MQKLHTNIYLRFPSSQVFKITYDRHTYIIQTSNMPRNIII